MTACQSRNFTITSFPVFLDVRLTSPNIMYLELDGKKDHRSYKHNFSSCEKKA